uniref:hypothetical protein n=1 Tax=Enterocloster clostridioformis TaxID=1531 RepID=UPI003078C393
METGMIRLRNPGDIKNNRNQTLFNLAFGMFLVLYLWFILDTFFWSDDRKYEFIKGVLGSNQWNIIQFIWERISVHVEMHGRFFPITSVFAEGQRYCRSFFTFWQC